MRDRGALGLSVVVVLAALACGRVQTNEAASPSEAAEAGGAAPSAGEPSGHRPEPNAPPFLPWQVGNTWTYAVNDEGVLTQKTTTVGPLEPVGGTGPNAAVLANLVMTTESDGNHTLSWQGPAGTDLQRIVRFREQDYDRSSGRLEGETYYDPGKLRFDGAPSHLVVGEPWTEQYTETILAVGLPLSMHERRDLWTVMADDEEVVVPAGVFTRVLHLRMLGFRMKEYWYARGVGKLKEQGLQLEELVSYDLVEP